MDDLKQVYGDLRENMILLPLQIDIYPFVTCGINAVGKDLEVKLLEVSWIHTKNMLISWGSTSRYRPYDPPLLFLI